MQGCQCARLKLPASLLGCTGRRACKPGCRGRQLQVARRQHALVTHPLHAQVTDRSLATLTGMSSLVSLQARGCPSITPAAKLAAKHLLDVGLAH